MPTVFGDQLCVDDQVYTIDYHPLEPWLASLAERPVAQPTPFRLHGYMATWAVVDDALFLMEIGGRTIASLLDRLKVPIAARWFSGYVHGWRGDRRDTGYPPHRFHDDEIVLEIASGRVVRCCRLDLRVVPDQTDEELRRSLPRFLWPAGLRGD